MIPTPLRFNLKLFLPPLFLWKEKRNVSEVPQGLASMHVGLWSTSKIKQSIWVRTREWLSDTKRILIPCLWALIVVWALFSKTLWSNTEKDRSPPESPLYTSLHKVVDGNCGETDFEFRDKGLVSRVRTLLSTHPLFVTDFYSKSLLVSSSPDRHYTTSKLSQSQGPPAHSPTKVWGPVVRQPPLKLSVGRPRVRVYYCSSVSLRFQEVTQMCFTTTRCLNVLDSTF